MDQQRKKEHAGKFDDEVGALILEHIVRAPFWKSLLTGSDVHKRGLRRYALLIYAIAATCLVYAAYRPRWYYTPASLQSQCKNNMKQLGLAFRLYHEQHGSFPPAYLTDDNGRPAHSWRVLLLPFLEAQAVYRDYRFDEPWNGPHNSKLADRIPEVYRCPRFVEEFSKRTPNSKWLTNYVALTGPHTCFEENHAITTDDITNDISKTMMVAETRQHSVHWMEPEDSSADKILTELRSATLAEQRSQIYLGKCSAIHGLNALFADGAVKFLSPQTDAATVHSMLTRNQSDDGSLSNSKGITP